MPAVVSAPQGQALIGQILHRTYRIEQLIGEGGMGAVYSASHQRLPRSFAIKVLHPHIAAHPEALKRFRREAEICSQIGHPHIIQVVDFNATESGIAYIVMEMLSGRSLEELLQDRGQLPVEQTKSIFAQAADALQAVHERGVVHRDLKPSNIFLCSRKGKDDLVKILDFGISKVAGVQSAMTATQATLGSPSYMAPEQAEGRAAEVTAATDVFAMGTILYEMLGGRPPFVGETLPAVLYQVVHHDPPPLRDLRNAVPSYMESAVSRALEKRPEQRFASMSAFADALETAEHAATSRTAAASGTDGTIAAAPPRRITNAPVADPSPEETALFDPGRRRAKRIFAALGAIAVVALFAVVVLTPGKAIHRSGTRSTSADATADAGTQVDTRPADLRAVRRRRRVSRTPSVRRPRQRSRRAKRRAEPVAAPAVDAALRLSPPTRPTTDPATAVPPKLRAQPSQPTTTRAPAKTKARRSGPSPTKDTRKARGKASKKGDDWGFW